MEFDFLPNLPKSNLDDRTFKDLVDECILRIPRYCPEWTNYNASDPGITLVELFAWLTDQMLLRFNQVPRRNYVAFLELLGIRLQPPAPARTEVTLYLAAALPSLYQIPAGKEVATERTETEEAIVFTTDQPLSIGVPRIRHFLTAETLEERPQLLRDRFSNLWTQASNGSWEGREQPVFSDRPQQGNCFYLVFEPDQPLEGNVLAITLRGRPAGSTGINPDRPPRHWEAWNGIRWQPILRRNADDGTRGFSFDDVSQQQELNAVREADVILHLPQHWPSTYFSTYQGRWLRCVYTEPHTVQSGYSSSPTFMGLATRSIGGTVNASQCTLVQDELLGESDGTPGQTFQLQSRPILPRLAEEHLLVTPPLGLPQVWQEVSNFAESGSEDRHYTIDSLTGQLQFGPLIREPAQLKEQTQIRAQTQQGNGIYLGGEPAAMQVMERQYGAIPPRGSVIRMVAYRTGGGRRGNVQAGTLRILKSAIPYVASVVNHEAARNGADAESLEDAVIRVPKLLRTRDRAVTPEDFELLTLQAGDGAVAQVRCPARQTGGATNGVVNLFIVPQADISGIERGQGISPDQLALSPPLQEKILAYLDERRLLGIQVRLQEPEYVGVAVQTEVGLEPEYNNPQSRQEILRRLQVSLYQFLNPLTGGVKGEGWSFGCPVYTSDIIALFQRTPGVRYLGTVLLFELRKQGQTWVRSLASNGLVAPGSHGLICSWADEHLRSGHAISLI
ncbi:MAG: putative baseplate assembly protein [Symplocastrum torsivum CPER-KK1]|uniref:Baseplate assembly protein n=1 Tax=Symplocastrum torsivum CPER-KK1 TaxID=450513 RepID=A0A951PNQ6_9CYAN|nr:putative baseplate assembly protein [Symplocastrum torsivum CPER-KK1]